MGEGAESMLLWTIQLVCYKPTLNVREIHVNSASCVSVQTNSPGTVIKQTAGQKLSALFLLFRIGFLYSLFITNFLKAI